MVDSCRDDECTLRLVGRDCLLKKKILIGLASEYLPHKILNNPKGKCGDSQYRKLTDNHLDRVIEATASRTPDVTL